MMKSRAGYSGPTLYATWAKNGYGAGKKLYLRDITTGSIGAYSAGPGYDQMTGIGAMIIGNFGKLLKKKPSSVWSEKGERFVRSFFLLGTLYRVFCKPTLGER